MSTTTMRPLPKPATQPPPARPVPPLDAVIETDRLTKRYGNSTRGIHGLSLTVARGEVFGFLGPKRRRQDDDDPLAVEPPAPDEQPRAPVRARQPSRQPRDPRPGGQPAGRLQLRGADDRPRAADVLRRAARARRADERPGPDHAGGVPRRRREHRARGGSVFLSSHDLDEVERICNGVGIVREGRLVAVEEVEAMRGRAFRRVAVRFAGEATPAALADVPGIQDVERDGSTLRFRVRGDIDAVIKARAHHRVEDLEITRPTLEERFTHRPSTVAYSASATVVAMYAIDLAGKLSDAAEPFGVLSAFRLYGPAIQDGLNLGHVAALTAATVVLTWIGAVLFDRRGVL